MKKLIISIWLFTAIGAVANEPVDVKEKVLKAFKETFTKATDVIWSEVRNTYYVRFRQSDIVTRASFDQQGSLLLTIRY